MRVPWKLIGVAGIAGVAATGVVVARKHRSQTEYTPDELRAKLHDRLAQGAEPATSESGPDPPDLSGPAHY